MTVIGRQWRFVEAGACADDKSGLMDSTSPDRIALAKALCAVCPVSDLCLAHGYQNHRTGVWGGLSL